MRIERRAAISRNGPTRRRALTTVETIVAALTIVVLLAILVPALGAAQHDFKLLQSMNNLRIIGTMHATYANDWEGRQWTHTPDNLSEIVCAEYPDGYPSSGSACNGHSWKEVPSVPLGFNCKGEFVTTRRGWAIQQLWYGINCSLGSFRAWNAQSFNNYANGKVYDLLFWAPRHLEYHSRRELIQSYIDLDCQWPGGGAPFFFPSYCTSVAAQVDPDVYRGPQAGGPQRALDLPLGHRTPNLANARYPDLKTHMIEHEWLNNWPAGHDPYIPDTGGIIWYYNASDRSEPATLFFDGSVRVLPVLEVLASNDLVVSGGEDRLWSEDLACFGNAGYFETDSFPPSDSATFEFVDMTTSYHVFTRDGILGRDTIFTD